MEIQLVMADKAEKLAAARRKLKEFQKKGKDTPSGPKTSYEKLDSANKIGSREKHIASNYEDNNNGCQNVGSNQPEAGLVFSKPTQPFLVPASDEVSDCFNELPSNNLTTLEKSQTDVLCNDSFKAKQFFSDQPYGNGYNSTFNAFFTNSDIAEDPKAQIESHKYDSNNSENSENISESAGETQLPFLHQDNLSSSTIEKSLTNSNPNNEENVKYVTSDASGSENSVAASTSKFPSDSFTNDAEQTLSFNSSSNTENLRQLSLQINNLMVDANNSEPSRNRNHALELEERNLELAAQLAAEHQKSEQAYLQLKEYQAYIAQMQKEMNDIKTESDLKLTTEISLLQEQLKVHGETVGILVGEKTELQAALTKSQEMAKVKSAEVEELASNLKASRQQISVLEKDLSFITSENEVLNNSLNNISKDYQSLKTEFSDLTRQFQELQEVYSEYQEKFNGKVSENSALQEELREKQAQLSLTQLKVQQLTTSDSLDNGERLEVAFQEKINLEKQLQDMLQKMQIMGHEKEQISQHYQQYIQQLNLQIQSLAEKLEAMNQQNDHLSAREESLVGHIASLEKQLQQQLQRNQVLKEEQEGENLIKDLSEKLSLSTQENTKLAEQYKQKVLEIEQLQSKIQESEETIEKLNSEMEMLKADQPNIANLLATMESDKVAASRAVVQNNQLKKQFIDLQESFVTLNDSKLDIAEKFEQEQQMCNQLKEDLSVKVSEIEKLKKIISDLTDSNQLLQQKYAEHSDAISRKSANMMPEHTHIGNENQVGETLENVLDEKDKMLNELSVNVRQLQMEKNHLLAQLAELTQTSRDTSEESHITLKEEQNACLEHSPMNEAMNKLQDKFIQTMKEVAELSEEKQQLEHLVLQLQSETETIGEYVSLYQLQRSILRKRTQENEEQLKKLAEDRREVRNKINQLNELIHEFMEEQHNMQLRNGTSEKLKESINNLKSLEMSINGNIVENGENIEDTTENSEASLKINKAKKIIDLLSEINTSNLVEPSKSLENFHPCPWCHGQLKIV